MWTTRTLILIWKGTSRQRSGKGAIRKRFPLQKPRWEKTKLTIRYLYHETIVSRMGSYFPNRWPLSYLNLTKSMKTYIRRQQHKKFLNTKTQNKKNHHRSMETACDPQTSISDGTDNSETETDTNRALEDTVGLG